MGPSLLWIIQTHLVAAAEVSFLQQRTKSPMVADLKQANRLLRRLKGKEFLDLGLYYRPLAWPLQAVSVTDAGHAPKHTSYLHEGSMLLIMSLRTNSSKLYLGAFKHSNHCVRDCNDLLELATGERGIPAYKFQRLSVFSIREERLSGRCRLFSHVPTDIMLADALTKLGTFPLFLNLMSKSIWDTTLPHSTRKHSRSPLEPWLVEAISTRTTWKS